MRDTLFLSPVLHDDQPTGGIDPGDERMHVLLLEVLVDCFTSSLPIAIVVDDQDAARSESRKQVFHPVPSRLVEVGIKTQERQFRGRLSWNRLFDPTFDEM